MPIRLTATATGTLSAEYSPSGAPPRQLNSVTRIDYRHIRPRFLCRPATSHTYALDLNLPAGLKAAYVEGPGEEVAPAFKQLGIDLTILDDEALSTANLTAFDVIVIGARAYEVGKKLIENGARLRAFVERGGTLLVQYQKYEYGDLNAAPYPMKFARPHDRVTDESAPVTILDPDHGILNFPHRITEREFDGWVQERGLYFWNEWDERYTPILASNDPGEEPKRGGLLIAKIGEGTYIYAGYAFFRQIPAGVEGAVRLFINLLYAGYEK